MDRSPRLLFASTLAGLLSGMSLLTSCRLDTEGSTDNIDVADAADDVASTGDGERTLETGTPELDSAAGSDTPDAADDTSADAFASDSAMPDTFVADTFVADTFVADTFKPDTFVADTFVADTFKPDTFEAAVDAGPPFCDPTDKTQIACWRFDGDAKDGSSSGANLMTVGVTYVAGVSGQAAAFSSSSVAKTPESATWAVTKLTIELWVRVHSLPTGSGRMGLMDDDGRFGLFIYPPGVVRAQSPVGLSTPSPLALDTWTHVAYTYDGATERIYIGGTEVATLATTAPFGTASGNGVAIGMNSPAGDELDGEIDSMRVWKVARSAKEICRAAGTC